MGACGIYCILITFMCGRTACTLARDDIVKACSYQDRKGKRRRPVWKDAPGGQQYKTSYNMAPGSFAPVLVSSKHFKDVAGQADMEHVVMPMKWGLVPRWHKDSPSKVSFKTSNCRGESMLEKATFKVPLQQGRRCVAVMDGFYEWKTTPSGKQPHYFQFRPRHVQVEDKTMAIKDENGQVKMENELTPTCGDHTSLDQQFKGSKEFRLEKKEIKVEPLTDCNEEKKLFMQNSHGESSQSLDKLKMSSVKQELSDSNSSTNSSRGLQTENENKVMCAGRELKQKAVCSGSEVQEEVECDSWTGHKLLTCAAVYDVWQPSGTSAPLYSYSIITVAASSDMSWCHHRMPAVLSTDQEVCDWLDFSTIPLTKANSLIQSKSDCLTSHPVSKNVNNSHYQSQDCLKPIDLTEEKKKVSGSGLMMMNWLKRGRQSNSSDTDTSGFHAKNPKI